MKWIMIVSWVSTVIFLLIGRIYCAVPNNQTGKNDNTEKINILDDSAGEIVKKVIAKQCAKRYTMTCFKMDVVDIMDLLSEIKSYQIFPGVAVVQKNSSSGITRKKFPDSLIRNLASEFPNGENYLLDKYLIGRINEYLSSHTVTLKLADQSFEDSFEQKGRGKGNKGNLMAGIMMMKGTLMTIGFGALAALAGKALLMGLLSLMLSAIIGLKSSHVGYPHKQTTYEIISKPIYTHAHTHSAEIQHDHEHGHAYTGTYSYGRNLDFNDGTVATKTKAADIEYIRLPAHKNEDDLEAKKSQNYEYRNVEYKTISDNDLKNYFNNVNQAPSHNHEHKYRIQKIFPDIFTKRTSTENSYFAPLTAATSFTTEVPE